MEGLDTQKQLLTQQEIKATIMWALHKELDDGTITDIIQKVKPYLKEGECQLAIGRIKGAVEELIDEFSRRSARVRGQRWSKP